MSIEVKNITKSFGSFTALDGISLDLPKGELIALLGPSGCGKTTLLRIIAGLEHADGGRILFHGSDMTRVAVRDRRVGFVFQHYALFGHMTIFENVAFGLRVRPKSARPPEKVLREIGLDSGFARLVLVTKSHKPAADARPIGLRMAMAQFPA